MRDGIEWMAPTAAVKDDGEERLDFGPATQPPGWVARLVGVRGPRFGWGALVPLALIAVLVVGPGAPQHRPATQSPVETGRTLTCIAVVLDSRTGRPVHQYGVLADLPHVACPPTHRR